jgi:hypothetical protein
MALFMRGEVAKCRREKQAREGAGKIQKSNFKIQGNFKIQSSIN